MSWGLEEPLIELHWETVRDAKKQLRSTLILNPDHCAWLGRRVLATPPPVRIVLVMVVRFCC